MNTHSQTYALPGDLIPGTKLPLYIGLSYDYTWRLRQTGRFPEPWAPRLGWREPVLRSWLADYLETMSAGRKAKLIERQPLLLPEKYRAAPSATTTGQARQAVAA